MTSEINDVRILFGKDEAAKKLAKSMKEYLRGCQLQVFLHDLDICLGESKIDAVEKACNDICCVAVITDDLASSPWESYVSDVQFVIRQVEKKKKNSFIPVFLNEDGEVPTNTREGQIFAPVHSAAIKLEWCKEEKTELFEKVLKSARKIKNGTKKNDLRKRNVDKDEEDNSKDTSNKKDGSSTARGESEGTEKNDLRKRNVDKDEEDNSKDTSNKKDGSSTARGESEGTEKNDLRKRNVDKDEEDNSKDTSNKKDGSSTARGESEGTEKNDLRKRNVDKDEEDNSKDTSNKNTRDIQDTKGRTPQKQNGDAKDNYDNKWYNSKTTNLCIGAGTLAVITLIICYYRMDSVLKVKDWFEWSLMQRK